jgi:hypothetical protein
VSCRLEVKGDRSAPLPLVNGEEAVSDYATDGERWGQWVVRRLGCAVDASGIWEVLVNRQWRASRYSCIDGERWGWRVTEMIGDEQGAHPVAVIIPACVQRHSTNTAFVTSDIGGCQQVRGMGVSGLLWDWARRRSVRA